MTIFIRLRDAANASSWYRYACPGHTWMFKDMIKVKITDMYMVTDIDYFPYCVGPVPAILLLHNHDLYYLSSR